VLHRALQQYWTNNLYWGRWAGSSGDARWCFWPTARAKEASIFR